MSKLYNEDCLETMKRMADKSVDFIITDPPYGINIAKWDIAPIKEYFDEIMRVSKNQIIFGGNFFDLPKTESWVVWYKQPFLKNQAECELIWTSLKIKPKVLHYRYAGNCEGYPGELKVDYKKKSKHPTQKPIEIMRWLISNFTDVSDTLYDPFFGSGATLIAAQNLNREYSGSEIDKGYYDIALEQLKATGGK